MKTNNVVFVRVGESALCQPGDGECPGGVTNANCIGEWRVCGADCRERYEVHFAATGTGTCTYAGQSRDCTGGNCPAQCSLSTPAAPKILGSCPRNLVLEHGQTCVLLPRAAICFLPRACRMHIVYHMTASV